MKKNIVFLIAVIIFAHKMILAAPVIGSQDGLSNVLVSCKVIGGETYLKMIARPVFSDNPSVSCRWPRAEVRLPSYGYITERSNMDMFSYSNLFGTTQKVPDPNGVVELRLYISSERTGDVFAHFPLPSKYRNSNFIKIDMFEICPNAGQGRQYDLAKLDVCFIKGEADCYPKAKIGY